VTVLLSVYECQQGGCAASTGMAMFVVEDYTLQQSMELYHTTKALVAPKHYSVVRQGATKSRSCLSLFHLQRGNGCKSAVLRTP
jgi:hypothetical protein